MEEATTKEDFKTKATNFKDHARDYVQTYAQLAKAKATKGASTAVSGVVIGVVSFFFAFFFLFFVAFGIGWWLGGVVNSRAGGFFLVAALFCVLTVLLLAMRKKVLVPLIRNAIIKKVYE